MKTVLCAVLCVLGLVNIGAAQSATEAEVAAAKAAMVIQRAELVTALSDYYSARNSAASNCTYVGTTLDAMEAANPGWTAPQRWDLWTIESDIEYFSTTNTTAWTTANSTENNEFTVEPYSLRIYPGYDAYAGDLSEWDSYTEEFNLANGQTSTSGFQRSFIVTNCNDITAKMYDLTESIQSMAVWMDAADTAASDILYVGNQSLDEFLNP